VLTHRKGGKAIWNILSEYGKQVLVVNVPMTYPPEPVNGIMVSGYASPGAHLISPTPRHLKMNFIESFPATRLIWI
jgi:predicted AlkP superfamily phosphohydrolase/phosphomutase